MPADSTPLDEEGVVIAPTRADDEMLRELAEQMRKPGERLADLRAQRAANLTGARRVAELVERLGADGLAPGWPRSSTTPSAAPGRRSPSCRTASYEAEDVLEGGRDGSGDLRLRVRATIAGETLRLDFAGSDDQVEGNLNCPLSVTKSAAFFAVRVLTDPEAPPSAGRPPAGRGRRAARAACSTPARRRRSRPATSRPRAGSPTW